MCRFLVSNAKQMRDGKNVYIHLLDWSVSISRLKIKIVYEYRFFAIEYMHLTHNRALDHCENKTNKRENAFTL